MAHASPAARTGTSRAPLIAMAAAALLVAGLVPSLLSQSTAEETRPAAHIGKKLVVKASQAADGPSTRPAGYQDRPAKGLVYRGLGLSKHCPGGFALQGSPRSCTHGPDGFAGGHDHATHDHGADGDAQAAPSPAVDVRDVPSTTDLIEAAGELLPSSPSSTGGQIPCYGDGVSGPRVQTIYAVASDKPDRYLSLIDTFPVYAARTNAVFANSAQATGGSRNLRYVHTGDCRLDVLHVVLSPTGDDTFSNMVTELKALGLTRTDRKYLVWADASVYCGIGSVTTDEVPGATNRANSGPHFARVDAGCWGSQRSVEAHEIAHNLGAVQLGAPNSNGSWHCVDDYDRMCYDDGSGATMRVDCPDTALEGIFDCSGNDYFNVNPAPSSWLATHWNLVNSVFLSAAAPDTYGTVPSPSPSPTTSPGSPTPTASPTPTSTSPTTSPSPVGPTQQTATFSSSLNKKQPVREFSVTIAAGAITADLQVKRAASMTLTVVAPDGSVVSTTSGTRLRTASAELPAGTYRLRVDGATSGSFVLTVTYRA